MTFKSGRILWQSIYLLILFIFLIISIYPVVWMFFGSLKSSNEFYTNIWGFSSSPSWSNYSKAWINANIGEKLFNSIIVTVGSLAVLIPVNTFSSYAIARLKFKGKRLIYMYLLIGIMIPTGVLGIPTFTVALNMGLNNSRLGLVLIYAAQAIAMGIFIMRSFFVTLPKALEEAAIVDGCTRFGSFIRIILPLAKAGVVTQVIFNGLTIWNEYFMANIMITSQSLQTLPLAIANFTGQHITDYPVLFAVLSIATLPIIIIYVICQKSFIEGVAAGAVKG